MTETDIYARLRAVPDEQRIEMLRKNWMSHDARWQMAVFQEFGWEKGNKVNKAVAREMGKIAMYRSMKALGVSQVKNVEELEVILSAAMSLYYPPPTFVYHFERLSNISLLGVMEKCGIYENVKKAGVSDVYECACFAMHSGWFEALGIKAEEELAKCLRDGDKACEIVIRVNKWRKEKGNKNENSS